MSAMPWILISILVLLVLLAVVAIMIKRKTKTHTDYYSFFIIGLIWFPLGIATKNSVFWIVGLAFMVIGLVNKDKWKQNRQTWDNISKEERKIRVIIMVVLGILVLAALVFLLLANKGIL